MLNGPWADDGRGDRPIAGPTEAGPRHHGAMAVIAARLPNPMPATRRTPRRTPRRRRGPKATGRSRPPMAHRLGTVGRPRSAPRSIAATTAGRARKRPRRATSLWLPPPAWAGRAEGGESKETASAAPPERLVQRGFECATGIRLEPTGCRR
jgi:uncharacterized protein YbjT (DUF2867 family)